MNIHWKKLRIPHLRFSARGLDKPPQQQYLHHVMSSSPSPTNNNDQSDRHSSLRESTGQDRDSSTKLLGGLLVPCHDVAPISIRAVTAAASRPRPTHGDLGWMTFTVRSVGPQVRLLAVAIGRRVQVSVWRIERFLPSWRRHRSAVVAVVCVF